MVTIEDIQNNENYSDYVKSKIIDIINNNEGLILTDYILETMVRLIRGENLLCVGPGGTGKSTTQKLCDYIYSPHEILRLAPTGMAAINMYVNAKTIHSILKIGEKSLLAWDWQRVRRHILKNKSMIKEMLDPIKLFIFDEFSMIISGLFDTINKIYNIIYDCNSGNPFGGRQVLFMGDNMQLPPVPNLEDIYSDNIRRYLNDDDYLINNDYFKTLFNNTNL